jgi:hypothetical protein
MKAAVIENGVVTNIVLVNSLSDLPNLVDASVANVGDLWDGVSFTAQPKPPKTREELKAERDLAVASIVVTTSTGKQFNGDETSQTRMARAIVAMQAANVQTITWVLATNDSVEVTIAELSEALVLAGQAQSAIWVIQE